MKRHKIKVSLIIGVIALGGVVAWFTFWQEPSVPNPVYAGKTAEEWFFGPTGNPGLSVTMDQARVAFRAMGTNCVPFLLEKARTQDSAFNKAFCWIQPKLPTWLQTRLGPAVRNPYIQRIAYWHLSDQVAQSGFMVKDVFVSIREVKDDFARQQALMSLKYLIWKVDQPGARRDLVLPFLDDQNLEIQLEAAIQLAEIDSQLTNGLPLLMKAITNTSYFSQIVTNNRPAASIGAFPGQLSGLLQAYQRRAQEALRRVSPEAANQIQPEVLAH